MKLRILTMASLMLLVIYIVDLVVLRFRHERLGTVTVQTYDAIPQKNGKIEFQFEQPVVQPCVHSIFPHQGYPPCWYLSRHSEQRINY